MLMGVGNVGLVGRPGTASPFKGGLPPLPAGFALSVLPDGSYEFWPDGAYVVEYVG
jgi:hypothetical protein